MEEPDVTISVGLSPDSTQRVAALYWVTFSRKLGAVLGRRRTLAIINDCINPDRVIVAQDGDEVVGFAGLTYDGTGFFTPEHNAFVKHYGPLIGSIRARLWKAVQSHPRPHQLLLDGLGVHADFRSRRIGTALLEAVDSHAAELGKTEVILEVVDTNPRARALYERYGYQTVHTSRSWMFRLAGFSSVHLMVHRLPTT